MTLRTWGLIILVAAMNVTMNVALKLAARSTSAVAMFRAPQLWVALAAGTSSIVLLLLTYRSNIPLARAILVLGATSVLLGVSVGIIRGERLSRLELGVLALLLLFYVTAWVERR